MKSLIRFAKEDDISGIMKFIDTYWRKGHILGVNESFFRYEHQDGENVNFVISLNEGAIDAILGFIPYGKERRDIMNVMWKVHRQKSPVLGLKLLDYLYKHADVRTMSSPGINKKTIGIYEYLGYNVGKMKHWYRLNKVPVYKIAAIADNAVPAVADNKNITWREPANFADLSTLFDFDIYKQTQPKPHKENWYIKKRYFEHPIYKYHVVAPLFPGESRARTAFFYRLQPYGGSCAIRLVDCIGDFAAFRCIAPILDELMARYRAEYTDVYETGLPDEYMQAGGWLNVEGTENIIPDYFAPYERTNVDIYYFSTAKDIVLFKGDGDQDRPN